jgi:hypothetical protein
VILNMRDRLQEFSQRTAGFLASDYQALTPPAPGQPAKKVKIPVRDDS